eukprot:gene29791-32971_t
MPVSTIMFQVLVDSDEGEEMPSRLRDALRQLLSNLRQYGDKCPGNGLSRGC